MGRCASAVVVRGFRGALAKKVRARWLHQRPLESRPTCLRFFVEWLAGVGFGRCGLIARVPQDRMLSRSDTSNESDGKVTSGNGSCTTGLLLSSKFKAQRCGRWLAGGTPGVR